MLWTTPESLQEELPLFHSESGLTITADARVDNRDELISALGIKRPHREITDSDLILEAYRKWGQECPAKIIGDFAFAIWDQRREQLFCARDPMGIKCFYYFSSTSLFAFGSEIKALFCLPEVPQRLNEVRVLDYLGNFFNDRAITFYNDIYRLPAASTLAITRAETKIAKYWSLDPSKELKLSSPEEYTEAFRDCFVTTVRARMRSAFPIGSALSGGIDSSSIACVARQYHTLDGTIGPLHTFSLIFPSFSDKILRQIDERKYMQDVLHLGGFQPHFIQADELSPMRAVERVHHHLDEPLFINNLYLHWAMYETANREGVRVFLDGLDGDTTVSYGFEYLAELLLHLKWNRLRKEVRLLAANLGVSSKRIIRDYCVMPFCPTWVYELRARLQGKTVDPVISASPFMKEELKERLLADERIRSIILSKPSYFRDARTKHWEMLSFPLYAHALEAADKASAAFKIEARYPFFDRRLIELCLSVPAEQKLGQGWSRLILRRAMAGILPESVQWRLSKSNLSPNFYTQLLERDRPILDDVILNTSRDLEPYVDVGLFRKAYEAYTRDPLRCHANCMNIFAAVNLAVWLRTVGLRS